MQNEFWDELSTGIAIIDVNTAQLINANTAYTQLLGTSLKALKHLPLWAFFEASAQLESILCQLKAGQIEQGRLLTQLKPTQTYSIPSQPSNLMVCLRRVAHTSEHILVELTELSQPMEAELTQQHQQQYQREQAFAKTLVHEIKNPLGGIRGAAQLLALEHDNLDDYTNIIIKETDRLTQLLDRLTRPETSSFNPETFNIHEICEHVLDIIQCQYHAMQLIRDYDISLPHVWADRGQITQIILNLALNAAQAPLPNHTTPHYLKIKTRIQRQTTLQGRIHPLVVAITIEDNGIGVPTALLPHLFHPIQSTKNTGSGLGLSIAQGLIRQHNGTIKHQRIADATQFIIEFPLSSHASH